MFSVSVIVPVYNVEKYLQECLDSILSQTYTDIEVIVVDDGSPDGCPAICDEYAKADPRVTVIHKKNGGLSDARNAGLDMASGDFITFCDSDDVILPHTLSRFMEIQKEYDCDVVSGESHLLCNGAVSIIDHYHKTEKITHFTGNEYIGGFFNFSNDCSVCNKLYRKDIIGNHRFEVRKTNEDILFQYEVLKDLPLIIHINEGVYLYRVNDTGITHTFNANSLFAYRNSVTLYDKVRKDIPEFEEQAFCYRVINGYSICRSIIENNKRTEVPYRSDFKEIRQFFRCNLIRIVKSSYYSGRQKLRFLYLILGMPLLSLLKHFQHHMK